MLNGKLFPKIFYSLCLLVILCIPSFADDVDDQALSAALSFTATIDDGNFQAAYWMGSPLLQLMTSAEQWIDKADRTQRILGKVLEREVKKLRTATSPAHFPDDEYRMIYFESRAERKAKAAEVILLHRVDGLWRVCDYSIR
ncbi:Protein of unknown function [Malonomonas rubra DSM 5091]|uniref:DUF4019 domain-containing protein n=2 Tax=Malonomonas rubra TaxID=57040 RepID=A0A1M6LNW3_MALRU|nr:Protein of unknown function [Malonomonas rubra DSM 5091]